MNVKTLFYFMTTLNEMNIIIQTTMEIQMHAYIPTGWKPKCVVNTIEGASDQQTKKNILATNYEKAMTSFAKLN